MEAVNLGVEVITITPNISKVIEKFGRICYESDCKITETSSGKFVQGLVKSGHSSVIEHASMGVMITGISRTCSHQIVRHRIGQSYSQKSQRYVNESGFDYILPPTLTTPDSIAIFHASMVEAQKSYNMLIEDGVKKEDARSVLPNACSTTLGMTGNMRAWRDFIILRASRGAQWEVRNVAIAIWKLLFNAAPDIFGIDMFKCSLSENDFVYLTKIYEEQIVPTVGFIVEVGTNIRYKDF